MATHNETTRLWHYPVRAHCPVCVKIFLSFDQYWVKNWDVLSLLPVLGHRYEFLVVSGIYRFRNGNFRNFTWKTLFSLQAQTIYVSKPDVYSLNWFLPNSRYHFIPSHCDEWHVESKLLFNKIVSLLCLDSKSLDGI